MNTLNYNKNKYIYNTNIIILIIFFIRILWIIIKIIKFGTQIIIFLYEYFVLQ
jgi:hypothetical protein